MFDYRAGSKSKVEKIMSQCGERQRQRQTDRDRDVLRQTDRQREREWLTD